MNEMICQAGHLMLYATPYGHQTPCLWLSQPGGAIILLLVLGMAVKWWGAARSELSFPGVALFLQRPLTWGCSSGPPAVPWPRGGPSLERTNVTSD